MSHVDGMKAEKIAKEVIELLQNGAGEIRFRFFSIGQRDTHFQTLPRCELKSSWRNNKERFTSVCIPDQISGNRRE
jgi:hypothetical protein